MNEKDLVKATPQPIGEPNIKSGQMTRAKHFRISPTLPSFGAFSGAIRGLSDGDQEQVVRTVEALAETEIPFEKIVDIYDEWGFKIEEEQADASIINNPEGKKWGVTKEDGGVRGWRYTGETITITAQLAYPANSDEGKLAPLNPGAISQVSNEQQVPVVEGITLQTTPIVQPQPAVQAPTQPTVEAPVQPQIFSSDNTIAKDTTFGTSGVIGTNESIKQSQTPPPPTNNSKGGYAFIRTLTDDEVKQL